MTKKQKPEKAIRYRVTYRDMNLYIIVSENSVSYSIENSDHFKTLAGLSLIETLINELLQNNYDLEDIAGLAFSSSYRNDDLPRLTQNAILYFLEKNQ